MDCVCTFGSPGNGQRKCQNKCKKVATDRHFRGAVRDRCPIRLVHLALLGSGIGNRITRCQEVENGGAETSRNPVRTSDVWCSGSSWCACLAHAQTEHAESSVMGQAYPVRR